jgi:hypothetical protein
VAARRKLHRAQMFGCFLRVVKVSVSGGRVRRVGSGWWRSALRSSRFAIASSGQVIARVVK